MATQQNLKEWAQEKYQTIGFDERGNFIGKDLFRNKLIGRYANTGAAQALDRISWKAKLDVIRRIVDSGAYLPTSAIAVPSIAPVPPPTAKSMLQSPSPGTKASGSVASGSEVKPSPTSKTATGGATAEARLQPSALTAKASISRASSSNDSISNVKLPVQLLNSKVSSSTSTSLTIKALIQEPKKQIEDSSSKSSGSMKAIQAQTTISSHSGSHSALCTHSMKDIDGVTPSDRCSPLANDRVCTTLDINHVQVPLNSKIQELINENEKLLAQNVDGPSGSDYGPEMPIMEHQLRLLDLSRYSDSPHLDKLANSDIQNAVIFSPELLKHPNSGLLPQYGLLGSICPTKESFSTAHPDPRLFLNVNIPFSAFICGLQGSGKSHTMACILENSLIQNPIIGVLQRPLSALVFHFGQYSSRSSFRPCEAAFLAYRHPDFREYSGVSSIHIMVAPSNYHNLNDSYSHIPGVDVRAFKLRSRDLNISSMMTLMSVDKTEAAPLYIGQITRILRELATESAGDFNYLKFKKSIEACDFTPAQKAPLQQRLDLLESFLDLDDSAVDYSFEAGSITIIDLSCPFVDANTACVLFNICMDMYLGSHPTVGKLIAIDEAHKYITNTPASKALTESLLNLIRQQRHYGVRVIISTQEPTISPRLMDLCSIIIIHRFSSLEWFNIIRKHISVVETDKTGLENLFGRIVSLRVGEALLFAPLSILSRREEDDNVLMQLSSNILKVKIRLRLTWDGGKSIVCL